MLHGLLLAGGKSSRMGRDKNELVFRGRTLLDHAVDMLMEAGVENVLISGDIPGYESLPDLIPECGPPGGVYSAVQHLAANRVLDGSLLMVIPVDMPLLTAETLSALVDNLEGADSVHYAGEVFPCVFRLTNYFNEYLMDIFREESTPGGIRSMKSLLRAFREKVVSIDGLDINVFRNVNHPEEWKAIRDS